MVSAEEDEDLNAERELEEELSIPHPEPTFLFKFPFSDDSVNGWVYTYYMIYGGRVKAQESEIDALLFWTESQIMDKIKQGTTLITPDS